MKKTGSDILLESLLKNNIDTIFWYPWWAIMPLYDKIEHFDGITHILVRNEQGAAFAAQWISRSSNKLWVAIGTSGPWATNLITGIMDAYMDSIPTLFITGQVAYPLMGNDVFQEVDIIWATMSCVKHSFLITDVNCIPSIVNEAIKIATTWRPWPVLIDFPKDVSLDIFTQEKSLDLELHYNRQPHIELKDKKVQKALKLLTKAKRPILLIGQWIKMSGAESELEDFVNTLQIPTVTTLLWKWILREDNENYHWMLWMHWFYEANLAMHNADVIINIWSRFDDRIVGTYESFWKKAKIIHVDIDKSELNKVVPTKLCIHADAKEFLEKINIKELSSLDIHDWRNQIVWWKSLHPFEQTTSYFSTKKALNIINDETTSKLDSYTFVTDVGQHQMWSAQILKVANTQSWLSSGWAGTMGFALPTSMWAAWVNPDKNIIAIIWDWWIQMNIQELQVVAEHNLNIKIIIMNNNFLWMVRQWQELFFDKNYASTPITSPNYQKIADAYWIRWYAAENETELMSCIKKEFNTTGPCIIEVRNIADEDNIFPMVAPWMTLGETMWKNTNT